MYKVASRPLERDKDSRWLYMSVTGPTVDKIADVSVWWPPALGGHIHHRDARALGLSPSARYPSNWCIVVCNYGKGGQFHEDETKAKRPPSDDLPWYRVDEAPSDI
eukprot:9470616-Pyramimonas_sp.AAC.1